MSIIGDFAFPGERFVLSEMIDLPTVDIEIERLVAHAGEGLTPYFRIAADDFDTVECRLAADPTVEDLDRLDAFDGERFYRAHWVSGSEGLMAALKETEGAIMEATFHERGWEVRLLFADRDDLTTFFERCRDEFGFDIDLVRVFDRSDPEAYDEYGLIAPQRDALTIALEKGYFEVPKQCTITEIAEEIDVAPQRYHSGCVGALERSSGTRSIRDSGSHTRPEELRIPPDDALTPGATAVRILA